MNHIFSYLIQIINTLCLISNLNQEYVRRYVIFFVHIQAYVNFFQSPDLLGHNFHADLRIWSYPNETHWRAGHQFSFQKYAFH